MGERSVLVEAVGDVAVIGLNRPESLNALNTHLLTELVEALREVQSCGAIVIQGEGRAFCAGEDLNETLAPETGTADELRVAFGQLQDLTRLMSGASCPVVSAIHGYAIGGGAEIAVTADFVIAGPGARLKFPEAVIGHAPTGGITARLPLLVGALRAKDLLLTGRWVDAQEGLDIGLFTEIHESPKVRALALATELASYPRRSQAAVKRAVELALVPAQETYLQLEIDLASYCFESAETEASFDAFRNRKRLSANS
ncbi:enoyl-CoA hydratase/isomerase family protein [Rhodococcus erythropolis]|uniref:enoyl-CoA hydratase/isomerase family protein n=1 Tax=Rhodococcus erythropolis TaxID=1833 RepID=UPI004040F44F